MSGDPKYKFVFDSNHRGTVYPHHIRDAGGIVVTFPAPHFWDGQQERYEAETKELFRIAETTLAALNGATPPDFEIVPDCNKPTKSEMSGEKELASWVDILLEAAREAGFANRMSLHYLHTFSKAIRKELESRATPPGLERVPEGTMEAQQALDEIEAVLGDHKSAFSRVVEISIKKRLDIIRAILTAHRTAQKDKEPT